MRKTIKINLAFELELIADVDGKEVTEEDFNDEIKYLVQGFKNDVQRETILRWSSDTFGIFTVREVFPVKP